MSTIKTTNITHGSNSGTANITLASDGTIALAGQTGPAFYGSQDTNQTIAQDTPTKLINLGNDAINTSGWDESTGTFTVPSGQGGIYFLTAGVGLDDLDAIEYINMFIRVNDSQVGPRAHERVDQGSDDYIHACNGTWMRSLNAGDTVSVWVDHNDNDADIITKQNMTWFGGFKIA